MSYPKNGESINSNTPKEKAKVSYPEFNDAIRRIIEEIELAEKQARPGFHLTGIYVGKTDMMSAFCNLGMRKLDFSLLVMKARSPIDRKVYFFADKCLPFGTSISCVHFQAFSDAVAFIHQAKTLKKPINYLDDFLFASWLKHLCIQHMKVFMDICGKINFPVLAEKMFWLQYVLVFLGLLIDTINRVVAIPNEKIDMALTGIRVDQEM